MRLQRQERKSHSMPPNVLQKLRSFLSRVPSAQTFQKEFTKLEELLTLSVPQRPVAEHAKAIIKLKFVDTSATTIEQSQSLNNSLNILNVEHVDCIELSSRVASETNGDEEVMDK